MAELCCQIQVDPYKNWAFQAVQLEQPDSILVLRYRIYEHITTGETIGIRPPTNTKKWKKTSDEEIEIPINNGVAPVELNKEHKMQIIAAGSRTNRQVEPGMYFWQIGADSEQLRYGVSINGEKETDLNKLGWLRWDKGQWGIRKSDNFAKAQVLSIKKNYFIYLLILACKCRRL